MSFAPEPPFSHGRVEPVADTAVLLCNLGTPDAPTAAALRPYLAQFLSDPRVLEIPRALWMLILMSVVCALIVLIRWPTDGVVALSGIRAQQVFRIFA